MPILAVLAAIGTVLTVINGLYTAYQTVEDFSNNPDEIHRQRYEAQMVQLKLSRGQILEACTAIAQAISQINKTLLLRDISDKLGDADQAQQALDNWRRTANLVQRDLALDVSAGALADVLQFLRTGTYPDTSLILPLMEILLIRLVILKEADSGFIASPTTRRPIEDSISLIRSTSASLEAQILAENRIQENRVERIMVSISPVDGRKDRTKVTDFSINYQNISGTSTYSRNISFEFPGIEGKSEIEQYRAEASIARMRGTEEDLHRAQIQMMRDVADKAEKIIIVQGQKSTISFL